MSEHTCLTSEGSPTCSGCRAERGLFVGRTSMFESIVDQDRQEYAAAARNAPVWREPQPPTRDDLRDEWGDE